MLQSGGVLLKTTTLWSGTPATWGNWPASMELTGRWSSYSAIYREQLWVAVLVNKRAKAEARLPLKVYERNTDGRQEARGHPYAALLRNPHPRLSAKEFWRWTRSTRDIHGEAIWIKERDKGGRPIFLHPIHPTNVTNEERDGRIVYEIQTPTKRVYNIDESDVVHFKEYNPDTFLRGMSPLEPLRQTLVNEDAARRANSAFWRNGSRPSVALSHPKQLSDAAIKRVQIDWERIHSGADNWGKVAVLEEGMLPHPLSIPNDEAQYIEARKLNREEACAIYDVPPPVVHILDRATFSNITEQMRSMYRDTMAPLLGEDEDVLEKQVRGSVRKGSNSPDFGDDVYSEFLMDEVLRGAFEDRAAAMQSAVNSGLITPNEARTLDNRPPLPGGDRLYINSTMVPIDQAGASAPVSEEEADAVSEIVRTVMGRLSRQKSLDEVDPVALVAGLNGHGQAVLDALNQSKSLGEDVPAFRARLQSLGRS